MSACIKRCQKFHIAQNAVKAPMVFYFHFMQDRKLQLYPSEASNFILFY